MSRVLAITMMLAMPLGCSTKQHVSQDPLGSVPEDFSLDMTVLTGPGAEELDAAHLRQSRFVLLPDGTLRFGVDADRSRGANWLPDVARSLTRQQVADVWALARQAGLTDPSRGDERVNFALVTAGPDQVVYLAALTGDGKAWAFIRRDSAEKPDPALTPVVRLLARLAWAQDVESQTAAVMPKRYNFGPDPYARYRTSATTQPEAGK